MANLLLCSAVANADGQASRNTAIMRKNCARHLIETIDILQPTLVISQGWGLVDTPVTSITSPRAGPCGYVELINCCVGIPELCCVGSQELLVPDRSLRVLTAIELAASAAGTCNRR
jgi:hypothetical protein